MDLGDYAEWGDALDERYLINRAEHEAHAEGNDEEPDDDDVPFEECGAVAHLPGRPPQAPCCKPAGHEHGPETDWKRGYHSNGMLKWPVTVDIPEPPSAPEAPLNWDSDTAGAWGQGWGAGWEAGFRAALDAHTPTRGKDRP